MQHRAAALLVLALTTTAPVVEAQQLPRWLSKLSVHGYVNQAYAVSDEYQIFGIPTEGTTDYRDLALQFRYDQDARNVFVLQIRQERLGDSPISELNADVELDWAFYQRQVNDSFSFKAGRIPLPLGIFNEAQGAGTTFPFYRPSSEFYFGQYTSKTLEGVLGSFSTAQTPRGWNLNFDAYYGQWALLQQYGETASEADAKNAFGGQLWVNTPIEGLRFGGGAYRCTVHNLVDAPAGTTPDFVMLHGSIEADFDRWLFATEYLTGDLDASGRYSAAYVQLGTYLTKRISVHGRAAVSRLSLPHLGYDYDADISEDLGIAVNYAFHPSLVFKLEGHSNDGLLAENGHYDVYAAPTKTRYFIASIAATF